MTTPILFLDVDGPLNPRPTRHNKLATYQLHQMRPIGWDDERMQPLPVHLNRSHGSALMSLPFELVWATSWEHEANELIGPHLGLPKLPVVEFPKTRKRSDIRLYWKTETLVGYAAGRPFAWVDDEITLFDREYVASRHDGYALLRWIDPIVGLTDEDFALLREWAVTLAA